MAQAPVVSFGVVRQGRQAFGLAYQLAEDPFEFEFKEINTFVSPAEEIICGSSHSTRCKIQVLVSSRIEILQNGTTALQKARSPLPCLLHNPHPDRTR